MSRFAVVVMLPDDGSPDRIDFTSREFEAWEEFATAMAELEAKVPTWRLVTVCHVEDLPLLMEGPTEPPTHLNRGDLVGYCGQVSPITSRPELVTCQQCLALAAGSPS